MSRVIFRGASLLDGRNAPRLNTAVVVERERIVSVLPDERVECAAGDRIIDLGGRTLMPGMCSSHFHATDRRRIE